jgi:hypothetical protein
MLCLTLMVGWTLARWLLGGWGVPPLPYPIP